MNNNKKRIDESSQKVHNNNNETREKPWPYVINLEDDNQEKKQRRVSEGSSPLPPLLQASLLSQKSPETSASTF